MKIQISDVLFVIPARGGSKRLPKKNIKLLAGKPLIYYSLDIARQITDDCNICISTDSDEIISVVNKNGYKIPFKRPYELASDTATTNDVLVHAVNYYHQLGKNYKYLVLLQVTSPLRRKDDIIHALSLLDDTCDMVVSVKKSHAACVMCNENDEGFLTPTFKNHGGNNQLLKEYYEYNGSIYAMKVESLLSKGMSDFNRKKYVMPDFFSTDIDTEDDFIEAEAKLLYLKQIKNNQEV